MADQEVRADRRSAPRTVLHTRDGVVLVVGLVLGAGIFRAPQLVAGGSSSGAMFLALWVVGGVVSLLGALCYAELAAAYPNAGGEYHFLNRAFGRRAGFLCAWSRMTVIQTGSIALLSFLVGDYVATLLGDGEPSANISAVVAAGVVVGLTLINVAGLRQSGGLQYALTALEVGGLVAVIIAGLVLAAPAPSVAPPAAGGGIALAMVFVLLTFGGWSEAAYISAELRDRRRGAVHTFAWGLGIITVLYLLANAAYLRALGLAGRGRLVRGRGGSHAADRGRVGCGGGELRGDGRGAFVGQRHHDHRREEQLRARSGRPALRASSATGTRGSTHLAPHSCCRASSRSSWSASGRWRGADSRRWWRTPRRCSG